MIFLRFMYVKVFTSTSFILMSKKNSSGWIGHICVFMYYLLSIGVVLFSTMYNVVWIFKYKFCSVTYFLFSWVCTYLAVKLPSHKIIVLNVWGPATLFSKVVVIFYILIRTILSTKFPTSLSILDAFYFILAILLSVE